MPEVWVERVKRLEFMHDLVTKDINRTRKRQKVTYNKGRRDVCFNMEVE